MADACSIVDCESATEAEYEGYDKFDRTLELSKPFLLKLDEDSKMKVLRLLLKNPSLDGNDVINLCMLELQNLPEKEHARVETSVFILAANDGGKMLSRERLLDKQPSDESCVTTPCRDHMLLRERSLDKSSINIASCDRTFEAVETKFGEPIICRFRLPNKPIAVENKKLRKSVKVGSKRPSSDGIYFDDGNLDLPTELKERIAILNGSTAVLVIEKPLSKTDLSKRHSRLSIPMNQVMNEFLRPEEKALLSARTGKGIEARIIGAKGKKRRIYVTKWKTQVYNLVKGWNRFAKRNKLRSDKKVQLWSFRVRSKLWFALVEVRT